MAADATPESELDEVDRILRAWRQGDCVLGDSWFAYRISPPLPLTDAGRAAAAAEVDLAEEPVAGLVVVTQTCDIVQPCRSRPFVEVAPLVEVGDERLREIQRARRPSYAYLPALSHRRLVAHLDRVMTVEKPVVSRWSRTAGCVTQEDSRRFAQALARKRERAALPDDFVKLTRKLRDRLQAKHESDSDEGRALRALREIRVVADPDWSSSHVRVTFWFVRETDDDAAGRSWSVHLATWLKLVASSARFAVDGAITTLADMTADEYVHSDPLDLDHLSLPAD